MEDLLAEFESSLDVFFVDNNCKCSFRRCKHEIEHCDYSVYVTKTKGGGMEAENIVIENETDHSHLVSKLIIESKSWGLKIKDVQISSNYLLISLDKADAFFHCFNEVLRLGNTYGMSSLFFGKKLVLTSDLNTDTTLTLSDLRLKFSKQILQRISAVGGATIVDDLSDVEVNKRVHLGRKEFKKSSDTTACQSSKFLFVAPVVLKENISPVDYKEKRKKHIIYKSEDKSNHTNDVLETLTHATILFDLFKTRLNKPVKLTDHCDSEKGAVFVLYNYARLKIILDTFEDKSSSGFYPKLPQLQDLDFSLLFYDDEWRLVFDYILAWPSVVSSILKSLSENDNCNHDCKIHSLVIFLLSLSSAVSSYYRKTQILREPRPQLLPYLFVRIYLVKAVMQVMDNCFKIFGIEPLSRM